MADTVKPTETVKPEALENNATPAAAPVANAADPAEIDRLKKDAEQARMRANQTQNELDKLKAAQEEADKKKLEEQAKFKELYEQEKSAKEELLTEKQSAEKQQAVKAEADKVLADYSDEVKTLAKDLGVNLNDDSDEAVADFKAKLDSAAKRVGVSKVTPNNPAAPSQPGQVTGPALREILADPVKRDAYMREHYPTTASMMNPQKTS